MTVTNTTSPSNSSMDKKAAQIPEIISLASATSQDGENEDSNSSPLDRLESQMQTMMKMVQTLVNRTAGMATDSSDDEEDDPDVSMKALLTSEFPSDDEEDSDYETEASETEASSSSEEISDDDSQAEDSDEEGSDIKKQPVVGFGPASAFSKAEQTKLSESAPDSGFMFANQGATPQGLALSSSMSKILELSNMLCPSLFEKPSSTAGRRSTIDYDEDCVITTKDTFKTVVSKLMGVHQLSLAKGLTSKNRLQILHNHLPQSWLVGFNGHEKTWDTHVALVMARFDLSGQAGTVVKSLIRLMGLILPDCIASNITLVYEALSKYDVPSLYPMFVQILLLQIRYESTQVAFKDWLTADGRDLLSHVWSSEEIFTLTVYLKQYDDVCSSQSYSDVDNSKAIKAALLELPLFSL